MADLSGMNGERRSGGKRSAGGKAIVALRLAGFTLAALLAATILFLAWLRWDAGRPRDAWWAMRQGTLAVADSESLPTAEGLRTAAVRLRSDTGLEVGLRALRPARAASAANGKGSEPLPVLVILGGHRTGREAAELIGDIEGLAVVALDYPYEGPHRVRGLGQTIATLPRIRAALLDTPPALSLALDWLHRQPWADRDRIVLVGVSLGVPFSAAAAARDERFRAVALVHGAADNREWLELNLSQRIDAGILQGALATVVSWFAYAPLYDTPRHVAAVAPRPVVIVGARDDERVPAGATERLFAAAHEPKSLRFTEGLHIRPGRSDIIDELIAIAEEELPL